jgi:hypothetical protein
MATILARQFSMLPQRCQSPTTHHRNGKCRERLEIKGAARKTVRPKSREETPKEGNETSDEVTGLASLM